MNILIVDDDPEEFEIFREALAEAFPFHINCVFANNGQEALKILATLPELPDYIFSDVNMPKMGGMDFLKRIRNDSKFDSVKVVMSSTCLNPTEIPVFKKLGAICITKIATFKQFVSALKSIIENPN